MLLLAVKSISNKQWAEIYLKGGLKTASIVQIFFYLFFYILFTFLYGRNTRKTSKLGFFFHFIQSVA